MKVLCWDLDDTLGTFDAVAYEKDRSYDLFVKPPIKVVYGMKDLLKTLSSLGYVNFVATNSVRSYAEEALNRAGIREYFSQIFDRFQVRDFYGKIYGPVLRRVDFSDEDARRNMVIIGNNPTDQPVDIDGIVFIQDDSYVNFDAAITGKLIDELGRCQNGNFNEG